MASRAKRKTGRDLETAVEQEESLLQKVQSVLAKAGQVISNWDYSKDLISLRDALADEHLPDDQAILLDQMDRVAALSAARAKYNPVKIDRDNPYFAHLRLNIDGLGMRDILLGQQALLKDGVRIVDWRDAPIAKVFYRYREGDAFAEEIADRQMEGEVEQRRIVTIVAGRLLRVSCPQGTFLNTPKGWKKIRDGQRRLKGGARSAARPDTAAAVLGCGEDVGLRSDKRLPAIAALLDSEQYALLTRDPEALLVVAGGAGSGKTTVGLHRLAWLVYEDAERFRPKRMLVMVFGRALARYIERVLPALGVSGVAVETLGHWALSMRKRHFPELAPNVLSNTPAVVVRFKTHRILLPMLQEAVKASPDMKPESLFEELFTDREWIVNSVKKLAPDAFSDAELEQVYRWCADQHFRRVDPNDHDEDEEPPGYDEEDSMILLYLYQLRYGRLKFGQRRRLSYDHIMIDEVQDFSPLELMVLMGTARGGSITLAGDPAQKITENDFSNWSEVLDMLGRAHVQVNPLKVSYRSTRQIMELAQWVLGPLAKGEKLTTTREGSPVELFEFGGMGQAVSFLGDALLDLSSREPDASVAVLAREPGQADEIYTSLLRCDLPRLARVRDQEFSFSPGIEVTDVAQTKGLEFDYVVLVGLDRRTWPDTPASRHLLHVGLTRAVHQLWLLAWGTKTPLLPPWLKPRMGG